jgi:hypothetical protein
MRSLLKNLFLLFCGILVAPWILLSKLGSVLFRTDEFFLFSSQLLSLIPGRLGSKCRVVFYWATMEEFPLDAVVGFGAVLAPAPTKVGSKCYIADYAIVGYCHLGRNVIVGSKVSLIAGRYQHNFTDPTKAIFDTEPHFECLTIGDDAFFGEGSICMANVGEKSIIGAGSVVVKGIPPYCIAVGNPARVVKTRTPDGPWTSVPKAGA